MTFIQSIGSDQFERVDFAFFAADPRSTRNNWKVASDLGDTIVDLTYALDEEPGTSVRSPWIERQLSQSIAPELQPGPVVVAHPAATVLALLALRAEGAAKIERMVATVFEPASENGQKAMDELHEQTVNLLSFQELPKNVFDIQVAFNMLARYGQRSQLALEASGSFPQQAANSIVLTPPTTPSSPAYLSPKGPLTLSLQAIPYGWPATRAML